MRKIVITALVLLALLAMPVPSVSADVSSDDVTVTVTGDGTWSDGVLSVSLYPGQEKVFTVTVNSTAGEDIVITPVADGCVVDGLLTACFAPTNSTLVAGGSSAFNLTITAKGDAPPGVFSSNLTITADTEIVEPPVGSGVPDHITLTSAQTEPEVGDPHELTATVYDAADNPLPDVPVEWSVLSGLAGLSSLSLVTDANGKAYASADCTSVGTSTVRCRVVSPAVSETIDLTWIEASGNGNGNGNGNGVVTTPNIRSPIAAITFGELLVDGAVDKTVTIYNDGDGPLVVTSVARGSGSEDFTYTSPMAPFTINAGGSTDVTVRFSPKSVGELSATFTVTSNDPDTPGLSFSVSGVGKSRGQPAWKVFLIGVLIIGGCFGGYFYYKRWKAKKSSLDILAGGGGDDLDLAAAGGGGPDDELNLPD